MTDVLSSPHAFAGIGLTEQQLTAVIERVNLANDSLSVPQDQYRHQKRHIQKKRATDETYLDACRKQDREHKQWKYHNDPTYREKVMERNRKRMAAKAKTKSAALGYKEN